MKKVSILLVLGIIYAVIISLLLKEFIEWNSNGTVNQFVEGHIFNIQKFLYIINIFFCIYLYVSKLPVLSPMFITRFYERSQYMKCLITIGLKNSFIFVIYTIIMYIGLPILFGLQFYITIDLSLNILQLFMYVFYMNLAYTVLIFVFNRQIFAVLGVFAQNFTLLIILSIFNLSISNKAGLNSLMLICSLISIIYIAIIYYYSNYKELLSEK